MSSLETRAVHFSEAPHDARLLGFATFLLGGDGGPHACAFLLPVEAMKAVRPRRGQGAVGLRGGLPLRLPSTRGAWNLLRGRENRNREEPPPAARILWDMTDAHGQA